MTQGVLLALFLLLASPSAFAMRCGTRIVTEGTQDFQVRDRCGEPFYADTYYATEVFGAYGPIAQYRDVQYDVWYYNFGPSKLMRRFVFRDGVLAREETLGYGVDEIGGDCNPNRDYRGFSVGELVARCGEPASHRQTTTRWCISRCPATSAIAISAAKSGSTTSARIASCACSICSMGASRASKRSNVEGAGRPLSRLRERAGVRARRFKAVLRRPHPTPSPRGRNIAYRISFPATAARRARCVPRTRSRAYRPGSRGRAARAFRS